MPTRTRRSTTRTKAAKKPVAAKKVLVGIEMPAPTKAQLSKLRKLFTPKALASVGLGPRAIISFRTTYRRPRPR